MATTKKPDSAKAGANLCDDDEIRVMGSRWVELKRFMSWKTMEIWMLNQKNWVKTTKMDGENIGSKPYFLMDDLGVPLFLETPL